MKIETEKLGIETNFTPDQTVQISSREQDASIWTAMLINQKYSDGIEATAREIISNAIDAQTLNGDVRRIDISLPSATSDWVFTDHGPGMTKEVLTGEYLWLGRSTKRESTELIGAFGLGSKTPLAFATSYTLRSRVYIPETESCTQYTLILSKTEAGTIGVTWLEDLEGLPADSHGVSVEVAVNEDDVRRAVKATFDRVTLQYDRFNIISSVPAVKMVEARWAQCKAHEDENGSVFIATFDTNGNSNPHRKVPAFSFLNPTVCGKATFSVAVDYGGVLYEVRDQFDKLPLGSKDLRGCYKNKGFVGEVAEDVIKGITKYAVTYKSTEFDANRIMFVVKLEQEEVGVTDGRDLLKFKDATPTTIVSKLKALVLSFYEKVIPEISTLKSFIQARYLSDVLLGKYLVYQTIQLPAKGKSDADLCYYTTINDLLRKRGAAADCYSLTSKGQPSVLSVTSSNFSISSFLACEYIVLTNRKTYSIKHLRNAFEKNGYGAPHSKMRIGIMCFSGGAAIKILNDTISLGQWLNSSGVKVLRDHSAPTAKSVAVVKRPFRWESPRLYSTKSAECVAVYDKEDQCFTNAEPGFHEPGLIIPQENSFIRLLAKYQDKPIYRINERTYWITVAVHEALRSDTGWARSADVLNSVCQCFAEENPKWCDSYWFRVGVLDEGDYRHQERAIKYMELINSLNKWEEINIADYREGCSLRTSSHPHDEETVSLGLSYLNWCGSEKAVSAPMDAINQRVGEAYLEDAPINNQMHVAVILKLVLRHSLYYREEDPIDTLIALRDCV